MTRKTWLLLGASAAFCLIALIALFASLREADAPAPSATIPAAAGTAATQGEARYSPFVPGPKPRVQEAPRYQPIPRKGVSTY